MGCGETGLLEGGILKDPTILGGNITQSAISDSRIDGAEITNLRSIDGQASNDVVRTDAALPNPTQKVESYLLVDADTLAIDFNDRPRQIAGRDSLIIPDGLLQCTTQASSREVIASVTKIVEDVAEEYGITPGKAALILKLFSVCIFVFDFYRSCCFV